MKKRGQVTVFLVLGIVVVILTGLVFYTGAAIRKEGTVSSIKKTSQVPFDIGPVKEYAESCLKKVSEDGLWIIGEHGGYIDPDGNEVYGEEAVDSTAYLGKKVPYYLKGTSDSFLALEDIEEKLSRYVIVGFDRCFDSNVFEGLGLYLTKPDINYTEIGFDFDGVSVDSKVDIHEDSVIVNVEYPLIIKKKGLEAELKDFRVNLPIRLGRLYNASVGKGTPIGLLIDINNTWNDEGIYDLSSFNCDNYDVLKQINIYSRDNVGNKKIIQFVDYNPFYNKYLRAYTFQVAISNNPINFMGEICTGTVI